MMMSLIRSLLATAMLTPVFAAEPFAYFMSLKPGHFRTYSTPHDSFWCCVGSGMENHTRYGSAIYFRDGDRLYVNLFIPSRVEWEEQGLVLEQRSAFPQEETVEFTIKKASADPLTLKVRCPSWIAGPMTADLNGKAVTLEAEPGRYATVRRVWKEGDRLAVTMPMELRTEALEGDPNHVAFLYGPLVLAGDLGPVERSGSFPYAVEQWDDFRRPSKDVPVLVRPEGEELVERLHRMSGERIAFRTAGLGQPEEVTLRPYNELFYTHQNVYW